MNLEDLLIISFDGLNRAGKGTQINYLKQHLESQDYLVEVLRGDGSRPGEGSLGFYDPQSCFWKQWQGIQDKSFDDWEYAAKVLTSENYLRAIEVKTQAEKEEKKGIILLDRSYLSRWYMLRKEESSAPLSGCLEELTLKPDIYFILEVPKEHLLKRNANSSPIKAEFRGKNILTGYEDWTNTFGKIPLHLNIYKLDGTKQKSEIHEEVKGVIENEYLTSFIEN